MSPGRGRRTCVALSRDQLEGARDRAGGNVSGFLRSLVDEGLLDWDAVPPDVTPSREDRACIVVVLDEGFDLRLRIARSLVGVGSSELFRRCVERRRAIEGREG